MDRCISWPDLLVTQSRGIMFLINLFRYILIL